MTTLRERLEESGCSSEFIAEALNYTQLYDGDIDAFIEIVEDVLISGEDYEPDEPDEIDDEDEQEEDDPIFRSDYNYDGNDDNAYFEEEEDVFEEDDEDE